MRANPVGSTSQLVSSCIMIYARIGSTWLGGQSVKMKGRIIFAAVMLAFACLSSYVSAQGTPIAPGFTVHQIPLPLQPPASEAAAKLNGNWTLAGNREQKIYPMLSVNLAVDGNWIIGAARYDILCSRQIQQHFASDLTLIGELTPDGSFTLSSPSSLGSDGEFISQSTSADESGVVVKGNVPHDGSSMWKGTYAFTIPPYKPLSGNPYGACTSPQTGSFVATTFAPLNGIYSGAINGPELGSDVTVTIKVSQSGPRVVSDADGQPRLQPSPLFPLSATISVKGSRCFTHGISRDPVEGNQLYGNRFDMNFDMEGVAVLMVNGWVSGRNSDELKQVDFVVGAMGSKCFNAHASGTLRKQ